MNRISLCVVTGSMIYASAALAGAPEFKCLGAKISKAEIGNVKDYEAKDGLATKKYGGFVDRRATKPTSQCLITEAGPGETVVLHFDKKTYDTAVKGASMFPGVQCVFIDDGKELDVMDSPATDAVAGKDMLTKCPNETGYECDAGSNSERNSKYRAELDKKKLVMQSFFIRPSSNMKSAEGRKGAWDGREVFCQAFDKKSSKVLYAFQFKVGPAADKK